MKPTKEIDHYLNGQISYEAYWINGETATKEQIEEIKFNKAFDKEVKEVLSEWVN